VRPLVRLMEQHRFVFRIIGVMGSPAFRDLFEPALSGAVEYIDAVPQDQLERALKEFSVGVMPLVDDPWSRGKCGYKALLTMACGIPTIASPVGVNKDIIRHRVNGFLAGTETEWIESLAYVLTHADEMAELGRRGRTSVEERYAQEVCERQLLDLLTQIATEPQHGSDPGRRVRGGIPRK
jgi:glycosyltransferase involved in cell wall biosynthesis